jgi:tRNA-dihydrouridine synthase
MIGREIFNNPFAFEVKNRGHPRSELIQLLNLHLDLYDKFSFQGPTLETLSKVQPWKFNPLKRFFKVYIRDFHGASEIRDKLMHTTNTAEVRDIINNT